MGGYPVRCRAQATKRVGRRWRLRDRRIRGKLAVILALPLSAVTLLSGLIGVGAASEASRADQARRLVALGAVAGELADRLQQERSAAALVFSRDGGAAAIKQYRARISATDVVAGRFAAVRRGVWLPAGLDAVVGRIEGQMLGLPVLRQQVLSAPDVAASLVVFRYRAIAADLLAYRQGLSQVGLDAVTANDLRAAAVLSEAIESLGLMQVAVVRSVDAGRLTPAAQQEVVAADARFAEATQGFRGLASVRWQARLNARVGGAAVVRAERLQGVVVRAGPGAPLRLGATAGQWAAATGSRMELMHAVERELDAELLAEVTRQRDAQRRWLAELGVVVAAGLAAMVGIGWWVARSLTGSLTRLRAGAEVAAVDRLPRMVAQLDAGHTDPVAVRRLMDEAAEPVPVDGCDEVGQVAESFNAVVAAAVRLAGEQAALRGSVAGIFESLSRRLQQRSDRTMAGLDVLERDEQDPDRLAKLFALDHEATLLRRLIVGLHVLAGGTAGRPAKGPVPLPDLLRAASSEIDDYRRVEFGDVDAQVLITADAAPGLIHLLAELLDNAARFSPPQLPVMVDGRRVGNLLYLQVRDSGPGLREEDLAAVRQRLADPHRIDHYTTQQMGLPVVGRIAQRLGIGVELRSRWQAGTQVDITVATELFNVAPVLTPAVLPPARPDTAVLAGATLRLPTIAVPAVANMGPPPWPPPSPRLPEVPTPPAGPAPPLVIFEQVRQSSWFTDLGDRRSETTSVSPQWQAAAARAEAVRCAPVSVTAGGLPVRRAGQRLIPTVSSTARVPVQRDPEQVRRRVSAFQSGLAHAGRRPQRQFAKESSR